MKSSCTSSDPEIQLKGAKKFIIHFNIKWLLKLYNPKFKSDKKITFLLLYFLPNP